MKFDRKLFFSNYREIYFPLLQSQVDGLETLLTFIEETEWLDRIDWVAYILATIKHECADIYQPIEELGSPEYFKKYDFRVNLGNVYTGDGLKYRGRGYVQLTGRANYEKLSSYVQADLVNNPEKALDPEISFKIICVGMRHGLFTGKSLTDFTNLSPGSGLDFVNARKIVNGLDKAELIAEYAKNFNRILLTSALENTENVSKDISSLSNETIQHIKDVKVQYTLERVAALMDSNKNEWTRADIIAIMNGVDFMFGEFIQRKYIED